MTEPVEAVAKANAELLAAVGNGMQSTKGSAATRARARDAFATHARQLNPQKCRGAPMSTPWSGHCQRG